MNSKRRSYIHKTGACKHLIGEVCAVCSIVNNSQGPLLDLIVYCRLLPRWVQIKIQTKVLWRICRALLAPSVGGRNSIGERALSRVRAVKWVTNGGRKTKWAGKSGSPAEPAKVTFWSPEEIGCGRSCLKRTPSEWKTIAQPKQYLDVCPLVLELEVHRRSKRSYQPGIFLPSL